MSKDKKPPKTLEELETEVAGLKTRLGRIEQFLNDLPTANNYLSTDEEDVESLKEAASIVVQYDRASVSLLQRRLSIGYAKASRLMDMLTEKGVVAKGDGTAKPVEVLMTKIPDDF